MEKLTPKQKANYLIDKFSNCSISTVPVTQKEAIELALVVAYEFITVLTAWQDTNRGMFYWNDVVNELKKLID